MTFKFNSLGIDLGNDSNNFPIGSLFTASLNLNDDDFPDLIVTLNAQANNQVETLPILLLQSTGDGYIDVTSSLIPAGLSLQIPRDLHVADFNGDGRDDVFFSNHGTEIEEPTLPGERNRLLLSTPGGQYADAPADALPTFLDFSHHSTVGDFDGDGDSDIYVNNLGSTGGFGNYLLQNDGLGNFTLIDTVPESSTRFDSFGFSSRGTYATIAFDTDNDGDIDIFHDGIEDGSGTVERAYFENDGSGNFFLSDNIVPDVVDTLHIEADDITGDGFADVVIFEDTGLGADTPFGFQILVNDGIGGFRDETHRLAGLDEFVANDNPGGTSNLQLIDLDADGDLDIFSIGSAANFIGNRSYVFINDGNGFFDRLTFDDLPALTPTSFAVNADNSGPSEYFVNTLNNDLWLEDPTNLFGLFVEADPVEPPVTPPVEPPVTPSVEPLTPNGPTQDEDLLIGTQLNDTIRALGGNDTVTGLTGDDLLFGGRGNDKINGSGGNDLIRGNGGGDTLKGNGGSDNIKGNGGADIIKAGGGADTVKAGGGNDTVNGGGGADRLEGGGGDDVLTGKGGDDTLKGNGGADTFQFRASDRNDTILDFRQGQDFIEIISGANAFNALTITQDGADVLIGFGKGSVRVVTDNVGAFDENDFIF